MTGEDDELDRDLLLDREAHVEAVEGEGPYGDPGRPFDRRTPFWTGLHGALGVGVAALLAWVVVSTREMLILIGLSFFIAVGLEPIVAVLMRLRLRRGWAVLLVSLLALATLVGFLALAIPPLANELDRFVKLAPHYLQQLNNRNSTLGHLNAQYHLEQRLRKALAGGNVGSLATGLVGVGQIVVGLITGLVIVIVLTLYFLADLPRVTRTMYRLVPRSRRPRAGLLTDEAFARVGGYMLGNIASSVIAGVLTLVWLLIFGIPYPVLLSVFVALIDLIPIVGSTIGGIIVALVALTVSVPAAIATAAYYTVYRVLEDYLIVPRIMDRTVEVPGLVTIIAVLIGGALLGLIGALIAIPIAATVKLLLEEISYPRLDSS
ncbi:MAG TPA: AI-2E family transporter [Solirubrobacteraceae bacterium]|nr:AI-2E family transporter [Solirubrobacteraceae bacterium]